MPTSCRTVKGHCRKLSAGKKAKPGRTCQRNGSSGTLVKGHTSPKGCSGKHKFAHYSAGKIQAAFRKLSARRKSKSMAGKKRQFADTISSGHARVKSARSSRRRRACTGTRIRQGQVRQGALRTKIMKHEVMEAWRPDEDRELQRLIHAVGTRWHVIQRDMPHRTISSIRNRYSRMRNGSHHGLQEPMQGVRTTQAGHACDAKDTLALTVPVTVPVKDASEDDSLLIDTLVWETILAARDLGFDRLVHPPLSKREFAFHTSAPSV